MKATTVHAGFFGLAVGDALGVPVEFKDRSFLKRFPVADMLEFGTHHQPKGTWSDDSALTFCLAESLCDGFHLNDIAQKFILWSQGRTWTPHGRVFDIGIQTQRSINTLDKILSNDDDDSLKFLKYEADEYTNGNGALMRILPLLFHVKGQPIKDQFDVIWQVSALTHGHIRSALSCLIYIKFAEYIIDHDDKQSAYLQMRKDIERFFQAEAISEYEIQRFERIINTDLRTLSEDDILSDGYVLHSLEASLWCVLTSNTYKETVLKAVNLGSDTDTTGAIAGGVAGLIYGYDAIPKAWLDVLVRQHDILQLCNKFSETYGL